MHGFRSSCGLCIKASNFLEDPIKSAEELWAVEPQKLIQNRPAANGAIMRTAPIGLIFYHSLSDVITNTIEACQVTHTDPRCAASCVALTLAIALSLRGYDCQSIFEAAEKGGLEVLKNEFIKVSKKGLLSEEEILDSGWEDLDEESIYDKYAQEFKDHLHGNWETLDLDEGYKDTKKMNKIGYTFKCMGAAFHALRLADTYQKEKKGIFSERLLKKLPEREEMLIQTELLPEGLLEPF